MSSPTVVFGYSVSYGDGGYLTKHTQDFKCRLDDHRNSKPCGVICSTSLELYDDLQRKFSDSHEGILTLDVWN